MTKDTDQGAWQNDLRQEHARAAANGVDQKNARAAANGEPARGLPNGGNKKDTRGSPNGGNEKDTRGLPNELVYDVAIVGGGFAGLTLALALHHLGRGRLSLVLIDQKREGPLNDLRASAIAAGARRLLQKINAWPDESSVQPITAMRITDSALADGVRPSLLQFIDDKEATEPFAHMVENRLLHSALEAQFAQSGIVRVEASVTSTQNTPQHRQLSLNDGGKINARLVAACDGGRSHLRDQVKIKLIGRDYDQAALVTTIAHQEPHRGEAIEHFLEAGPFAALPLIDDASGQHRSSIVWTERKKDAAALQKLSPEQLRAALFERIGGVWGNITLLDNVQSFPLSIKLARGFVADRLALVGDAAHVIHPIAGQGLNLGFRDVAALAEVVIDGLQLGSDIGAPDILARYQRWRRFDTMMMGLATDSLNSMFSKKSVILRGLRSIGLGLVEQSPRLKNFFISSAAGTLGDVPRLMR